MGLALVQFMVSEFWTLRDSSLAPGRTQSLARLARYWSLRAWTWGEGILVERKTRRACLTSPALGPAYHTVADLVEEGDGAVDFVDAVEGHGGVAVAEAMGGSGDDEGFAVGEGVLEGLGWVGQDRLLEGGAGGRAAVPAPLPIVSPP